jgi:hypothetical protein
MNAEPPVEQLAFFIGVAVAGNAADQRKSAAVLDLFQNRIELRRKMRQRKKLFPERDLRAGAPGMGERHIDLGDRWLVQAVYPGPVVLDLGADPGAGAGDDGASLYDHESPPGLLIHPIPAFYGEGVTTITAAGGSRSRAAS